MKRIFFIISLFLLGLPFAIFSENISKQTKMYAEKNGQKLYLDIYSISKNDVKQPCLIFVFGGGFKEGERNQGNYQKYLNYFANKGFTVVSIDYRLGMVGQKAPSLINTKPLRNAIAWAVDDLYSATKYLITSANELSIDTAKIIISGSSAGAMTVLQADYEKRNSFGKSMNVLPKDFQFAGVISFAGSIFSTHGTPSYKISPAPTLFFHGSKDKLVPYNKTQFFSLGVFGSKSIAKQFNKKGYPYLFYSMQDNGHNVSEYPMEDFLPEINDFINNFVFQKKQWMIDINFKDKLRKSDTTSNPNNYYK